MKNYLILFIILVSISYVQGQDIANDYYEAGYFKEASVIFEKELIKEKRDRTPLQFKLADCYFQLNDFNRSIKIYEDLYDSKNRDSLTLNRLAELNRMFCRYDAAQKYYSLHKENNISSQEDKLAYENIIDSKIIFPKENSLVNESIELENLNLPQVKEGMGYTFLENGDLIGGIMQEDNETKTSFNTLGVFSSSSNYQEVQPFNFNEQTRFFNAYPSYCKTSKTLYYTANISSKKKSFKGNENVLQIYALQIESKEKEPELLAFNSPEYNFTHPSISDDGKKLYFVSNRPGGYGGYDVYYVEKTKDGWSDIKNCGENVNTSFNELTPFTIGDSLYFSSYGHDNYGGSDIFLSIDEGENYSKASNLGLPINSCMNDFSFILTPESGIAMLTSDRNFATSKKDDVYQVLLPLILNKITNEKTNEAIADVIVSFDKGKDVLSDDKGEWAKRFSVGESTTITFENPYYKTKTLEFSDVSNQDLERIKNVSLTPILISGHVINDITGNSIDEISVMLYENIGDNEWQLVEVKKTDKDGNWEYHVRKDKEYKVVLGKDDFISHNEIIPKYDGDKELRNEVLSRMNPFSMKYEVVKDLIINIENIYFDFNSSYIRAESFPILNKIRDFLNDHPDIQIELSAHTDCMGEADYNLWLSNRRAESSKKYLVAAGIAPERIQAKGYGKQRMIVTDCELQKRDDTQAQKNRRVEVKVL